MAIFNFTPAQNRFDASPEFDFVVESMTLDLIKWHCGFLVNYYTLLSIIVKLVFGHSFTLKNLVSLHFLFN